MAFIAASSMTMAASAANVQEDVGAWESVSVRYRATDRLSLHMMQQTWFRDCLRSCDQWYVRFWFMYKAKEWLSVGPGYELVEAHNLPDSVLDYYTRRNGFFAQAVLSQRFGSLDISVRSRFVYSLQQERKFHYKGAGRVQTSGNLNDYVSRTRFMVRYRLSEACPVVPFVYDEVFCWDRLTQNRPAIGCTFKCSDCLSVDLSYIRQTRYTDGEDRNNNILSVDFNFSF